MDKFKLLLLIAVVLVCISLASNIYQSCQEPKVVKVIETIDTTKIRQQFRTELETELRAELKPVIKYQTKLVTQRVNLDSLREAIDQFWIAKIQAMNPDQPVPPQVLERYDYSATGDLVVTDSASDKDTIATAKVKFLSRIPLDPDGKFTVVGSWYSRQITHTKETTIIEQKSFWQRLFGSFHYSIQSGFGMGLIHKQFDVYVGVGVSYDIGSIF